MSKFFLAILAIFYCCQIYPDKQEDLKQFLKDYPRSYQDILFQNKCVSVGLCFCSNRYDLISPILASYKNQEFSVLDIGAAQGYFSFRIAEAYPLSHCTMIESGSGSNDYKGHVTQLLRLCHLNDHLNNITMVTKQICLDDLIYLNKTEHFDVVLAFLVVHLMPDHLDQKVMKAMCENLFRLGDNVILEVVYNKRNDDFEDMIKKYNGNYLGELVKDHFSSKRRCKFYRFKNPNPKMKKTHEISDATFNHLSGAFPIERLSW